jgi:hypothetical protein
VALLVALSWGLLPAVGRGDVVRLKDGSTLRGRVLSLVRDTLTVRTSFGADVRIARSKIELVSFTDSVVTPHVSEETRPMPVPAKEDGIGEISVTFKDNKLSSKIGYRPHRDEEGHRRANWIEQTLIVDGVVVYSRVDSTMDKTIYQGPVRVLKNTIKLADFSVQVPAGMHHAVLVVRNVGIDDYEEAFDGDPLDVTLPLENIQVGADRVGKVRVGIERGRFRTGKPTFYREE